MQDIRKDTEKSDYGIRNEKKYNRITMISYKQIIAFIWQFMRFQKWTFLLIFFIDSFAWPLEVVLWPYILHFMIDIFSRYESDRFAAWNVLRSPIIGAVALVIYVEIASRIMGFLMAKAIPKIQADIRMKMFDHIQYHSPHYFNERFAGSLANKITDMTTQVESILQKLFWPIIPAISSCILGSFFLWFVNPIFSWIFILWIIIHLTICVKFTRSVDIYEHRHGKVRSTLLGKIVDSFTNNFAVNLFYRFKYEEKKIYPFQKKEEETNKTAKIYVEKMRCALSLFYFIGVILGVFGSILYSWIHGGVTTGQVIQVVTTVWGLSMLLWTVGSELPVLFQSFGIAKQAYSVIEDASDLKEEPNAEELKISKGEIIFDNVTFYYGEKKAFC